MSLTVSNDEIADCVAPKVLKILQDQLQASISLHVDGMNQIKQIQNITDEIMNVCKQIRSFKLDPNNPMMKLVPLSEVKF
jgi:hypothetical protein